MGSSQPSHFETEVLEKMTQDMVGLRKNNSEKDQEWARPSLAGFNAQEQDLCFQQIECEEGTLHDGKATVKLFGVTEVSRLVLLNRHMLIKLSRPAILLCFTLPTSSITSTLLLRTHLLHMIVKGTRSSWNLRLLNISLRYTPSKW
jgi:hypothetical protein